MFPILFVIIVQVIGITPSPDLPPRIVGENVTTTTTTTNAPPRVVYSVPDNEVRIPVPPYVQNDHYQPEQNVVVFEPRRPTRMQKALEILSIVALIVAIPVIIVMSVLLGLISLNRTFLLVLMILIVFIILITSIWSLPPGMLSRRNRVHAMLPPVSNFSTAIPFVHEGGDFAVIIPYLISQEGENFTTVVHEFDHHHVSRCDDCLDMTIKVLAVIVLINIIILILVVWNIIVF